MAAAARNGQGRPARQTWIQRTVPLVAAAAALGMASCSSGSGADSGIRVVAAQEVSDLLAADPAPVLIDVRTPAEFAQGHLAGAVLVDYNAPDFAARIDELPRDASYVIYCRSGNRSAGARKVMQELGFEDVVDIQGGIQAWTAAGLPVTTA